MKNIITILLIAYSFIASAQSPTEKYGYPFLGVRSESAVLVGATFKNTNLAEKAGVVMIVGNDTGWMWIDTLTGYFNFYPALNVTGAWTKSGTNIYPTTITDKVGIGKVPTYPFDLIAKDGGDSITLLIEGTRFEMIRYSGATDIASMSIGSTGLITFNSTNDINLTANEFIINTTTQSTFESGDVAIEAGELVVSDDVTCDTLFGVVSTVYANVYTPTLTNTTNVTSSTARQCTWSYNNGVVSYAGSLDVTTTLAVATEIQLTLPVASNLATAFDLNGTANASSAVATNGFMNGDATSNQARLQFIGLSVGGSGTIYFEGQYVVK